MNRNILIVIGVVVLLLGGGGLFIASQQSSNTEEAKMAQEKVEMAEKESSEDEVMMKKDNVSRYVEYSKTVLDESADKRRVLYFYATWCPSCKIANEDFTANPNKIPEDVVVIRTNYNDPDTNSQEKDLAKKYGITYQHTFVQIDSNGNEITKWNGGQTDELLAKIK